MAQKLQRPFRQVRYQQIKLKFLLLRERGVQIKLELFSRPRLRFVQSKHFTRLSGGKSSRAGYVAQLYAGTASTGALSADQARVVTSERVRSFDFSE